MTTIDHQPAQPVAGDWDWQLSAACRGMDVETFYHPAGERWHQKNERITQAKQEETIARRMTTMISWLKEGKSLNWKYERK